MMQKRYKTTIQRCASLWVLVLALVACTKSTEHTIPSPPGSYDVGFTIDLRSVYASTTRAITPTLEEGSGYENYIDILGGDYRFLFFDTDDKYIETMEVIDFYPIDDTQYPDLYRVAGKITTYIASGNFKVVVLASWGNYPTALTKGTTTIADVCSDAAGIYSYSATNAAPFIPSADTPIPMYGVKSYTGIQFRTGLATDLGHIDLLRAMAKVLVTGSTEDDVELQSVELVSYATKGYCAPLGMYTTTANQAVSAEAHIPSGAATTATLPFTKLAGEGEKYLIYVPEFDNNGSAHTYINVSFTYAPTEKHPIHFCEYTTNGKPVADSYIDVLRNYYYKFNVKKKRNLIITVDVVPYGEVKLDPTFGLDAD